MRYAIIIYIIILLVAITSCKKITPVAINQINGASNVCLGEKQVQYSVSVESPVDYTLWTVPEGAEITSGQGTNSIKVNFGRKPGKISVRLYNDGELVSPEAYFEVNFGISNQWCRDINLTAGTRANAVGFSIGNKGYIGLGNYSEPNSAPVNRIDFWEYDPSSYTWTQKTPFPGISRVAAVGFSIGNKGYVGTGYRGTGSLPSDYFRDFWEYDPTANEWIAKDSLPGSGRQYAFGFSVGDKGYLGAGQTSLSGALADFYEYDPNTDNWVQKNSFTYPLLGAVGFSIGNKGYVGTGFNGGFVYYNDFYEYNPDNDQWVQKESFPGTSRYAAVGFSIGNKGYIGTGFHSGISNSYFGSFYEYNPITGFWTEKDSLPGQPRGYAIAFSIDNKGYIGVGAAPSSVFLDDFWVFTQ